MTFPSQTDDKLRIRRLKAEQAVQFATQNKWHDAVDANRTILELFPNDVDAHNRLGKALMELGRFKESRGAYRAALEQDPNNAIAKKNLSRMEGLEDIPEEQASSQGQKIDMALFIEETGKTGYSNLVQTAEPTILARATAGDRLDLKVQGGQLAVHMADGTYLGLVEPRIGLRLAAMMEAGNKYIAAVQSAGDGTVRVVVREVEQHPSQAGKLSFPAKAGDDFRGDIRSSLVSRWEAEDDDDDDDDDSEYGADWEEKRPGSDDLDDGSDDDTDDMKDDDL